VRILVLEFSMKKYLLIFCFALIHTVSVKAEDAYTGFYGVVNLLKSTNEISFSGPDAINLFKTSKFKSNQPVGIGLEIGYGISFGDRFILSVGVTRDLNKPEILIKYSDDSENMLTSRFATSLYFAPGVKAFAGTLVYGKLSLESINLSTDNNVLEETVVNGIGYGLGIKSELNKNLFMQFELKNVKYDKQYSTLLRFEPSNLTGTLGMGVKF